MHSHYVTMGVLLLRATAALAWTPAALRMNGPVARSGRYSASPVTIRNAVSARSCINRHRHRVRTLGTSKTTATTARATSGGEDVARQDSSEGGKGVGDKQCTTTAAAAATATTLQGADGIGDVAVQPLLQPHMEKFLGSGGRRKVKTRQHVNPLAATFQTPAVLPERWFPSAFRNPSAPLLVDIGCAKGSFVRDMAMEQPERNFLGLEIRRPTAALALERAARLGTRNCHVVCCNANVDLDTVLTEAARHGALIDKICIQFPDPHFKAKHYKRRVLQPELVTCIEEHLQPGGVLFMQSDVLEVVEDMRVITRETSQLLKDSRQDMNDWMEGPAQNPFQVQTEREKATYEKESAEENRVYRCVFTKAPA